jgi:peptide/nickel transport system substrate-binding protein
MSPIAAIISPAAAEKYKGEIGRYPCGTGPFKLAEFVPEERVVLVRNEDYWGKKPEIQRVVYKVITDPATRVMALQAGEVDLVRDLPSAEISRLETDQRFKILKTIGVRTQYFGFNMYRDYFKDVRVRQAFNYAIDRESIVKHVMHGVGHPAKGFVVPTVPGHLKMEGYSHNPEKAKQLLAEAG